MARPTQAQMEALVEFLEENQDVSKGLLRTQLAKQEIKRKRSDLATTINALGGVVKDGPGWAKYWAEKKCALKKQCAQQAQSIRRTGGGPQTVPSLSALELRLVAVMGGQSFATGNSQVAVDPFSQTERTINPISLSEVQGSSVLIMDVVEEPPLAHLDPISGQQPSTSTQSVSHQSQYPISSGQQPSTSTHSVPHQSQHRARHPRLDAEVERFARIEEKRVDAEAVSARALADIAASLDKLADAVANIAGALLEISTKIQLSPPE